MVRLQRIWVIFIDCIVKMGHLYGGELLPELKLFDIRFLLLTFIQ
jgi:hypothetical protein